MNKRVCGLCFTFVKICVSAYSIGRLCVGFSFGGGGDDDDDEEELVLAWRGTLKLERVLFAYSCCYALTLTENVLLCIRVCASAYSYTTQCRLSCRS